MKKSGFSILELSIAVAIISILVISVISGQYLLRKFKLQNIIDDVASITQAVKNFNQLYGGFPGDLWNAESKFGATNTDNGNGNNNIATGTPDETLLFWQHLGLAALIKGNYDATTNAPNDGVLAGPFENSGYRVFTNSGQLIIELSKFSSNNSGLAIITPAEAVFIDSKYDDSNPLTGNITVVDGSNVTALDCINASNEYNLNTDYEACVVRFNISDLN